MLLLLSTTTPSSKAEKGRFDRFEGGSSSSVLKSSEFHVGVPGNKEEKHGGDQVFGAKKRKVYAVMIVVTVVVVIAMQIVTVAA
ncbi:hypothetical protein Lal_00000916 [Lupinus albus]|nr:hypothetical protein Lal_00000916 [Lupinus albus]